jgi:hypothetical protein
MLPHNALTEATQIRPKALPINKLQAQAAVWPTRLMRPKVAPIKRIP